MVRYTIHGIPMCCSRMWFTDVQKRSDHVMNANFHSIGKIKEYDYITQYTKDWTFINKQKICSNIFINMDNLSNYHDISVYNMYIISLSSIHLLKWTVILIKWISYSVLHRNFIIRAWFLYWLGTLQQQDWKEYQEQYKTKCIVPKGD